MVFGGFEGKDVKILRSNSEKALLCLNMRLLVYLYVKIGQTA